MATAKLCIPEGVINVFRKLYSGKENLEAFQKMTTKERTEVFKKYLSDDVAADVNKIFERKMLLKKQEEGFEQFLKTLSKETQDNMEETRRLMKEDRDRKKSMIYNADGSVNPQFESVAAPSKTIEGIRNAVRKGLERKYGIDVTDAQITELQKVKRDVRDAEDKVRANDTPKNRLELGMAKLKHSMIVESIAEPTTTMGFRKTVSENLKEFTYGAGVKSIPEIARLVALVPRLVFSQSWKAMKSAIDLSGTTIQGTKMFWDDIGSNALRAKRGEKLRWNWFDSVKKSLSTISTDTDSVRNAIYAEMMGDPKFDEATEAGLRLVSSEEFYPTHPINKIPYLGGAYRASDNAYTILNQNYRFRKYKDFVDAYKVDNPEWAKLINKETHPIDFQNAQKGILPLKIREELANGANSISGSGSFGSLEKHVPLLNTGFYSPRWQKSHIDTLIHTGHTNSTVAKNARAMLASYVGGTIGLMTLIKINGGEVETDIRSSKFGKVKVPGTDKWIALDNGFFSYVVKLGIIGQALAGIEPTVKSAASDRLRKLNTGDWGDQTALDSTLDFIISKTAPGVSVVATRLRGEDYRGEKVSWIDSLVGLTAPIGLTNVVKTWVDGDESVGMKGTLTALELVGKSSTDYNVK